MYRILFFMLSFLISQVGTFEEGVTAYNNRAENSNGLTPEDDNILKAISIFESFQEPYNVSQQDLQSGIYLTKSYYFMAQYVSQNSEDKKMYFELAKTLSDQYVHKYPDSVELLYWNLANMSNWAKLVGLRKVTQLGAADDYREKAVDIIVMDPDYEDGGGFFLLGAVYFTAPYIPLVISWPDDYKAIKYFKKATDTGRATPLQMIYLAKAFINVDEDDNAKDILQRIINTDPDSSNFIEDLHYINEAKTLWDNNF